MVKDVRGLIVVVLAVNGRISSAAAAHYSLKKSSFIFSFFVQVRDHDILYTCNMISVQNDFLYNDIRL